MPCNPPSNIGHRPPKKQIEAQPNEPNNITSGGVVGALGEVVQDCGHPPSCNFDRHLYQDSVQTLDIDSTGNALFLWVIRRPQFCE